MQGVQYSFKRYEKKYLLSPAQLRELYEKLLEHMHEDEFGIHSVCNIYFDTDTYELIRNSISDPVYKEKFRIRSYGVPTKDSVIYAEIKKKFDGVVYKRRIANSVENIHRFVDDGETIDGEEQIQKEIRWFLEKYHPVPKAFIGYERIALIDRDDPELRITFDWNIRWRGDRLRLLQGADGELIVPDNRIVMEIKIPEAMPLWLCRLLSESCLYPTSFSKYGACYRRFLAAGLGPAKQIEERKVSVC